MMNGHPSSGQVPSGDGVTFVQVASERGIARTGLSYGVAWGDFNGDGFIDLYTNNHHLDLPSLYRNDGGHSFSDIADEAGLINRDLHGAAWADYDEDGDLDLYQNVGYNQPSIFYRNDGAGTLTNVASAAGVEDRGRGRDVAWADYDRDGDLDLFITNQSSTSKLFQHQGDGTFVDRTGVAGLSGLSGEAHLWGDYNNDGWLDILMWTVSGVRLFRNNGDGTFTDKSTVLSGVSHSNIKDVDWADYDNDGDLDLYVSRGYQHPGITWNADRLQWHTWAAGERGFDWHLSPSSAAVTFDMYRFCGRPARDKIYIGASGAHPASMPFTLGNGQGPDPHGKPPYTPGVDTGIFIWVDQSGEWHLRSTGEIDNGHITSSGDLTALTPYGLVVDPSPVSAGNELWENRGEESFVDVTEQANVGDTSQSWAALWGDFDNDSDLDLYVSNHGPFLENEPNTYYVNDGDKTFTEGATSAGLRAVVGGRGGVVAAADYDRDGFLDIFLTNGADAPGPCEGPDLLFDNQGNSNHWLQVRTVGTISNRDGIGAYLALQANGMTQYRQQLAGKHAYAQDSSLIHFGLGTATTVQSLTITWPSGIRETYTNLMVDQIVTLTEGKTPPTPTNAPTPTSTGAPTPAPTSTGTPSPATLVDIRHESDLSEYDLLVTDGGDLSQSSAAALGGTSGGMQVVIDSTAARYGTKSFASLSGTAYRFRHYVDPSGLSLPNYGQITLAQLRRSGNRVVTLLQYTDADGYRLYVRYVDDNGTWRSLPATSIGDTEHYIEVLVEFASSPSAWDGRITYWVDDVQASRHTGLDLYDLDGRPNQLRMGAIWISMATSNGTLYLDEFVLRDNDQYIGPVSAQPTPTPSVTSSPTQTATPKVTATATVAPTPTGTLVSIHHEHDLAEYNWVVLDEDLVQSSAAALAGTGGGLQITVDDTATLYGTKTFDQLAGHAYRFRHYVDPNGLVMPNAGQVSLAQMRTNRNTLTTRLRYSSTGGYQLYVRYVDDNGIWRSTSLVPISDGEHSIEVLVKYASSATANDGQVSCWVDGVLRDRDIRLDLYDLYNRPYQLRMGATWVSSASIHGTLYLDEFVLRADDMEIGP